jgi:hypothetical protein
MATNSITIDCALLITRGVFRSISMHARSQNARAEILQHLLELYPGGVHVVEEFGMLPLHYACDSHHPRLEIIRILAEAAPHTVIQKCTSGRTPIQHAWNSPKRDVEVKTYLIERQNEAVNAMKEAFEDIANTQLGLPDLVLANVWSFAKPDVWTPDE